MTINIASGAGKQAWHEEYDLIVLGSGGAGLTAALVGTIEGLRTLVIEKTEYLGGTTALSAGTCWIPNNSYLRQEGVQGDDAAALQYLDLLVDGLADREIRTAFLAAGPEMLGYLEKQCDIRWRIYKTFVDYRQEFPGAGKGGRPLEPMPFDGRMLGRNFSRVRWPVPEWALFGGKMMVTRPEAFRLLKIAHLSPDAFLLGARVVLRYLFDRLRGYKRGTRLVLGNALVANLFKNLLDRGGSVWFDCRTTELIIENGRVSGLVAQYNGKELRIHARRGVVLAAGGFPGSAELRQRYLRRPAAQYTRACGACTGDTMLLAQGIGAAIGPIREDNALWFPSSIGRRSDGSTIVFPHIWDRAKPGLVAVNSAGRRFVDESVSYHEFTRGMYLSNETVPSIPAMLVCDRRFLWKYGLGMIRPLTPSFFLKAHIESGYLYSANTLEELARKIGVDAAGLTATIDANNRFAQTGIDAEFNKGSSPYGRQYGDPEHSPNPCLGPIEKLPYFAIPVVPTPLGTSLGLKTDFHSRVLDTSGQPIPGLYACGCDAHSIMGGEYPGGGCQVGAGMTFGYIAALHAAGKPELMKVGAAGFQQD
ncbi:MAG: FAD-binding protein [Candidatus Korobacteraceae bacterium]|jgi:succinate dehydrogenase/fumarate reductase flavoprotein subunit